VNELERGVVEEIARARDELVALASALVAFDTATRSAHDDPAREEVALQRYLADRLGAAGAEIDLWEPPRSDVEGSRLVPAEGLGFEGRPQLAATFRGAGGGPSLMLNGHIDVVSAEPRADWTSDPFAPEVRDGRLYGRGAADMKGGVACIAFAAETLARLGVRLAGDVTVCTVTDEESTGGGGIAAVAHGVRADAGIVAECTNFDVVVACRGSLIPTVHVPGRPGHAGVGQQHWREGGAVNAIDKSIVVQEALQALEREWRDRADNRHELISPGQIVPVIIKGGDWIVTYPASCSVTYHIAYLPAQADEDGWGEAVEREFEECVARAAASDPWLAEHPPVVEWSTDVPAAEVPADHPIVAACLTAAADLGRPSKIGGSDGWHDGASFTRFGNTPSVMFGPRGHQYHAVDEHVAVDDLVACAQALALAALRYCRPVDGV